MKPFLQQVATAFYQSYGARVSRIAFVFPNKRAGLFFRKYLSELSSKPVFSPPILTIGDLFVRISGKQVADRISMLFTLHDLYIRRSGSLESFDEFLYWGEMLLNDFDDVDKYMANARMLFTNVTDLKQIESDFSFLNEKQIAAIRSFWSSFDPDVKKENEKNFLTAWELLYDLYTALRNTLAAENKGYEGMIFREVVERLQADGEYLLPWEQVVFVGLNALSAVETSLLMELKKRGMADFYWDYASPLVQDPDNRASFFMKENLRLFPSLLPLDADEYVHPEVEVIGIPSGIGQAKQVYTLLKEVIEEDDPEGEKAINTAVVLPDEQLLIPVLNAIPEHIRYINVTMGYPLSGTPVSGLMEFILHLQKNIRMTEKGETFYYRDVLPILNHRYIQLSGREEIHTLIREITTYNKIYITAAELRKNCLLETIFSPVGSVSDIPDYLICVLERLYGELRRDEEKELLGMNQVEREFIYHYFLTVNRLRDVMKGFGVTIQLNTYFRLLKRIAGTVTIPFQGEPLSGLQIMGVLETRALDFERVIILSVNEGVFPLKKAANSFIPYNLRKGFGLPTYEHQDSIWAYYFYRLISRTKRVSLLYDTRSSGLLTGEKSRYIHQMHYHYRIPLQNKLVAYNVSSSGKIPLEIRKSAELAERLSVFYEGGERALSASAINTYLDCPLKFYFSVIEGIQEEDEVNESVESDIFGSILHKVLEDMYEPLRGKWVTADLLKAIARDEKEMTGMIERAFAAIFFKTEHPRELAGRNYLIGEMIRKYVKKVLEKDAALTPFRYLESERRIKDVFVLSDGRQIQLKGFIDRLDELQDSVRIVDYKSGRGTTLFSTIDSLFDMAEKVRSKAVMQVFMYAWMYSRQPDADGKIIRPAIYYMRDIFSGSFDPYIYRRMGKEPKAAVADFMDYKADFEEQMRNCLDKIFDAGTPFIQSPNGKACAYCNFSEICGAR